MPYPFSSFDPTAFLTEVQSINAITEAEAGIISCLSSLLYTPTSSTAPINRTPRPGTLLGNLLNLPTTTSLQDIASLLRQILCSIATKEEAIADIISSEACMLAAEKGLFEQEECCPGFKRMCEN